MNLNNLNVLHPLRFSRQSGSSILNNIAENVISKAKDKEKEDDMAISQKIQGLDKKEEVREKKDKDEYHSVEGKASASANDISKLTGQAISGLRDGVENAAGNLEYYREKIKYLLSQKEEYQKRAEGEFTEEDYQQMELYKDKVSDSYDWEGYQKEQAAKKVRILDKELNLYYKGIEDIVNVHLSMAQGFSKIATVQYSNSDIIRDEYQKQFGDIADSLTTEKLGLNDLESDPEVILKKLDESIQALDTASSRLEEQYQSYTGKTLEEHTRRKSNEELQEEIKKEPILSIVNEEIIAGNKAPALQVYLGNFDKIAENLLDARG